MMIVRIFFSSVGFLIQFQCLDQIQNFFYKTVRCYATKLHSYLLTQFLYLYTTTLFFYSNPSSIFEYLLKYFYFFINFPLLPSQETCFKNVQLFKKKSLN